MIWINENERFEYVSSGLFKSNGTWQHPRITTNTYEIIFMYEGTAYICEENTEYTLQKNDVLILEPNKEHYGFRSSEMFVSFAWLHYRTDVSQYKNLKFFTATNPTALKTLFSQCQHMVNTPGYHAVCADLYAALYMEEVICNNALFSPVQNQLAARIKEYVTLHVEKNLTVKSVAEHFGYHENHVSRIFKSTYGILLKTYIAEQRLEYTRALLTTTLYTVSQIAQMASFKSDNHFIKFFKYHTKLTPTAYRNTYINTHVNQA